ncbi:hypothetical protein Tco_0834763 [Tanacetum coccineum]
MEAKEKGIILDAETEAFLADVKCTTPYAEPLAITTTTEFEVSHEDAYDSDVDEALHAAAAFMANLMQTGPSTGQGTSNDTEFHLEVHTYDNHLYDNMNLQVSQEIHGGEQLDSDVDSLIDDHDNTILYHQYQLNNELESVSTDVSSVIPGEIYVITILDYLRSQLEGHIKTNEEQSFVNDSLKAELERYKTQVQNLEQSKVKKDLEQLVFERNKRNADLEEQLVSLKQQLLQHVESNKSLKTDLHKSALGHRNPLYLKSAQLCRPTLYLGDVIVDPQVWKATGKIFASVGSKWKPTGRKFTLGDTCPLTRITKPEVVPLEKSGSVSTSEPANNVIVTPRFTKKPLTSYKHKDSKLKDTSTGSPPNAETKVVNDPVNANDLSANQRDPNKIRYPMS